MLRHIAAIGGLILASIPAGRAAADIELKNDGFMPGGQAFLHAGTNNVGEIAASRFTAPGAGHRLLGVRLLFGGFQMVQIFTLRVWNDNGGANAPGSEIFHGDFQLQGINSLILQDIPLGAQTIILPEHFRLGLEMHHQGAPRVGYDNDGSLAGDKNVMFLVPGGWVRSQVAGLTGD